MEWVVIFSGIFLMEMALKIIGTNNKRRENNPNIKPNKLYNKGLKY